MDLMCQYVDGMQMATSKASTYGGKKLDERDFEGVALLATIEQVLKEMWMVRCVMQVLWAFRLWRNVDGNLGSEY
jgi:hypothetical protein